MLTLLWLGALIVLAKSSAIPSLSTRCSERNVLTRAREAWKRIARKIVLAEYAEKTLRCPLGRAPPSALYLLYVVPGKPCEQETLPAITHLDGAGPLQTVFREQSPGYDQSDRAIWPGYRRARGP
jgi:predicted NodU family carbamoyl transferase